MVVNLQHWKGEASLQICVYLMKASAILIVCITIVTDCIGECGSTLYLGLITALPLV